MSMNVKTFNSMLSFIAGHQVITKSSKAFVESQRKYLRSLVAKGHMHIGQPILRLQNVGIFLTMESSRRHKHA